MPVNPDAVGRVYKSSETFVVSREHIRRFAEAIGDHNPAYTDPLAAQALGYPDVIAPPTFLTTLAMHLRDNDPIMDPELGLDYSMLVHGEQRFVHHRPARAGDVLTSTTTVEGVRNAGGNELVRLRMDIATTDGEPVCESYNLVVSRGTAAPTGS